MPLTRLFWAKYLGPLYLCLAVLAGLGVENLKHNKLRPRWSICFLACVALFVAAGYWVNPGAYRSAFEIAAPPGGLLSRLLLPVSHPLTARAVLIAAVFASLAVTKIQKIL